MKQYFIEAVDQIILALLNWNRRLDVSIKASTNGTTYDRYDPARGLHEPYEVKE